MALIPTGDGRYYDTATAQFVDLPAVSSSPTLPSSFSYTPGGAIDPAVVKYMQDIFSNNSGGLNGGATIGNWELAPITGGNAMGAMDDYQAPVYRGFSIQEPGQWYEGKKGYAYDPNGQFLQEFATRNPNARDWGEMATLAAIAAMTGGAALSAMGPAAAAGAGGAGGSGAVGGGISGFGDAGLMYAGADAAAAGSLGGGASIAGGSALGGLGAAGAGGALDLGGGITMGADGAISGATPFSTSTLSNAGILDSVGAGGLTSTPWYQALTQKLGAQGALDAVKSATGLSGSQLAGLGLTGLGALSGSGSGGSGSGSGGAGGSLDPRLEPYLYGSSGLLPQAQGLLNSQMPIAQQQSAQMASVGSGLLGTATNPDEASNPYLKSIADDMQRRTSELLAQNNNAIRGNSVAAGGLGGSRQGVAEGVAAGNAADSLQGQVANLYGNAYQADKNYGLQAVNLGSNLLNQSQSQAWSPLTSASGIYRPYTNLASAAGDSGTNWQGQLGGALAGASLASKAGWW